MGYIYTVDCRISMGRQYTMGQQHITWSPVQYYGTATYQYGIGAYHLVASTYYRRIAIYGSRTHYGSYGSLVYSMGEYLLYGSQLYIYYELSRINGWQDNVMRYLHIIGSPRWDGCVSVGRQYTLSWIPCQHKRSLELGSRSEAAYVTLWYSVSFQLTYESGVNTSVAILIHSRSSIFVAYITTWNVWYSISFQIAQQPGVRNPAQGSVRHPMEPLVFSF